MIELLNLSSKGKVCTLVKQNLYVTGELFFLLSQPRNQPSGQNLLIGTTNQHESFHVQSAQTLVQLMTETNIRQKKGTDKACLEQGNVF